MEQGTSELRSSTACASNAARELGLDIYAMRDKLTAAGLRYVDAAATRSVTQAF
jgi:hypothetical protein